MNARVDAARHLMVEDVGGPPHGCPWLSLFDPLVQDVLSVRVMAVDGNSAFESYVGRDGVPRRLIEGLKVFEPAYAQARQAERERERAEE